jgi:chorismate mutase
VELSELRIQLDQMTERIVSRLKDRSRFPLNQPVYEPDGVPVQGHAGMSLLEFSLLGLERYHASLGRYAYPDQHPMVLNDHLESDAVRTVHKEALPALKIGVTNDLIGFYTSMLRELCRAGEDSDTFGETAYVDADLLQLLNERVNVGRYVAQAKLDADPELKSLVGDSERLNEKLRDKAREGELIKKVRNAAARYDVDADVAERVFKWIIEETTLIEVAYLQGIAKNA